MRLPFWLFVIWDCPIGFCYLSSETSFLAFCYLRPPFRFLLPCFFLLFETSFYAFCYLRLGSQLTGLPAVHFRQAAPQLFKPSFHASPSHLPRKLDSPIWALKKTDNWWAPWTNHANWAVQLGPNCPPWKKDNWVPWTNHPDPFMQQVVSTCLPLLVAHPSHNFIR